MSENIDLRSLLGMIWRQIWLIVSIVVGITILTVIALYSITPKYSASALVMVDTSSKNLLDPETGMPSSAADNSRVESEVRIIQSDSVLLDVINNNNLIADKEFGVKLGLKDRLLGALRISTPTLPSGEVAFANVLQSLKKAISVRREGLTYLISISAESVDPQKAANLANALTTSYIRKQLESKVSSMVAGRDTLQSRLSAAENDIAENEKKLDQFTAENLPELYAQLQQLNTQQATEKDRLDRAQRSLQAGDLTTLAATLQSSAITELQKQRDALTNQLATAAAGSQKAVDLQAEMKKLEGQMREQATNDVNGLQQAVAEYQQKANSFQDQVRTSMLDNSTPPAIKTQYFSLLAAAGTARSQYQNLVARSQDLNAQVNLQLADSRVISDALAPSTPSYPNKPLILMLSFVASLGLGVGCAFLRENFIGGFTSDEQIEAVLRTPLAAVAPQQSGGDDLSKPDGHSLSDTLVTAPLSAFSESIRRIRVSIDQALYKKNRGTLDQSTGIVTMVSSSLPAEGKSTMAVSLARTYALANKRTLLIDCDLRKPSVHRHIGLQSNTGLVDFLRDNDTGNSLPNLTVVDPMTGLSVILGGRRGDFATDELLMGQRIARLIASAKKHFDYVILDTPPIEAVVDSLYLARHCDVIVFVVKWASTSQSVAKKSVAALEDSATEGTPIITVLNQQEQSKMLKSYKSYSGYYTE